MEAAAESLRLRSGRDRGSLNSVGPNAPLAIRVPSAAAAAARADGTRAPEQEQEPEPERTEAAPRVVTAMTFLLTPAARPAVRSRRRSALEPRRSAASP